MNSRRYDVVGGALRSECTDDTELYLAVQYDRQSALHPAHVFVLRSTVRAQQQVHSQAVVLRYIECI